MDADNISEIDGRAVVKHCFKEENGSTTVLYKLPDGQRHGPVVVTHRNGTVVSRYNYRHDNLHGKQERWHPNGKPAEVATWKNGRQDGEVLQWNERGILIHRRFVVDHREHGEVQWFYPSGKLEQVIRFENGIRHGESSWYSDGQQRLLSRQQWHNGVLVSDTDRDRASRHADHFGWKVATSQNEEWL